MQATPEAFRGYLTLARPINLLPSALLVFIGAWVCRKTILAWSSAGQQGTDGGSIRTQAGTGHSLQLLSSGRVWLVSLMSAGVAAASCIANDYFDFISGNDVANAPSKVC